MRTIKSITERDGPLWRTHCPMLDGLARTLPDLMARYSEPINSNTQLLTPSDTALLAFEAFRRWSETGQRITDARVVALMAAEGFQSNEDDARVVRSLALNMRDVGRRFRLRGRPRVRFELPACGVIESAHCDALWGECVVELKSVQRSLGVRDLRQVLLYGALCWASDGVRPTSAILANSLQGECVRLEFEELSRLVSGQPFRELARDIADYLVGLGVSG